MKKLLSALFVIILVIYPVIVYTGLNYSSPRFIAIGLIIIFASRLIFEYSAKSNVAHQRPWSKVSAILVILVLMSTAIFNIDIGVLLYPVAMNLGLLGVFAYSLYKKPSVIEVLARLKEPDLDNYAIKYTNKVTFAWCIFFIINGSVALYAALYMTTEQWAIYNGIISYILMALLMAVEFCIRLYVKANRRKSV